MCHRRHFDVFQKIEELKGKMTKAYGLYYVRHHSMARFTDGERYGPGIRAFGRSYDSFQHALDGLVKFASFHTGYDWARMDDDWTPEDGSLERMLTDRRKDYKKYRRQVMDRARSKRCFHYRGGCVCIGEVREDEEPLQGSWAECSTRKDKA